MKEERILLKSWTMFPAAVAAAKRLRGQFHDAGVTINPTSELGALIEDSIRFSQNPLAEISDEEGAVRAVLRGQYLDRIAKAARILQGRIDAKQHLWVLKKGQVDPGSRAPSKAKDKLWELELLSILKDSGLSADMCEPDITVRLSRATIALACKRIYSPTNAESQLSIGVKQIERSKLPGLLAVCIDDLLPPYCIIDSQDAENAAIFLDNHNIDFIDCHLGQLVRYISSKRIAGVLITSSAPIRHPPFFGEIASSTQMTIWTIPECDSFQGELVEELRWSIFGRGISTDWWSAM